MAAAHRVFRVSPNKRSEMEKVLADDVVSRQSIAIRDARVLGASGEGTIVIIEGDEGALRRAEGLFHGVADKLEGKEASEVYDLYRRESEDMASGLGLVFGS